MKFFRNQEARASQDVVIDTAIGDRDDIQDAEKSAAADISDFNHASAEKPNEDIQAGVKKVEAVTLIWTKNELIFAYAW
jgi:hypothetical protein